MQHYLPKMLHLVFERANYKVHLATGNEYPPLDAFFAGTFKEWQEDQAQRNFECDHVIGLIDLHSNKWLFAGVYKVLGHEHKGGRCIYSTELLTNQEELIGRLIIQHQRTSRASYLWGTEGAEGYLISEIREKALTIGDFPGYNATTISYSTLQTVVNQNLPSWKGALSNIKGVYLVSDTTNGAQYVGSALGREGIWQRWSSYAFSGHGGNVELQAVLNEKRYRTRE